jgi:hypothetical protein
MNALQTDRLRSTLVDVTRTGEEISLLLQASDLLLGKCRHDLEAFGNDSGRPSMADRQRLVKDVNQRISVAMGLGDIAAGLARAGRGQLREALDLDRSTTAGESDGPTPDLLSVVDSTRQVLELVESAVAKNDHWLAVAIDELQKADSRHQVTPEVIEVVRSLLRRVGRRALDN